MRYGSNLLTVGSAAFRVKRGPSAYRGEIFIRGARPDDGGHYEYTGSNGHAIRWNADRGAYCIGTPSEAEGAVWWENSSAPTIPPGGYVAVGFTLAAKAFEDGEVVDSQEADIVLRYDHHALVREKKRILVGEVAAWR